MAFLPRGCSVPSLFQRFFFAICHGLLYILPIHYRELNFPFSSEPCEQQTSLQPMQVSSTKDAYNGRN